jgi:hypothetical protein
VALAIEHLGPNASFHELNSSFEELEQVASEESPSEELFFFYYQKGRLLKRFDPGNPSGAILAYKKAMEIARRHGLSHRTPIASRWVLRLRKQNNEIGEDEYLKRVNECIKALKQYNEDRWAANTLHDTLLETAKIYRNRDEFEKSFQRLVDAFDELTRQSTISWSDKTHNKFRTILMLLDELNIDEGYRDDFVKNNSGVLKKILNIDKWLPIDWNEIKEKIN